MYKYLFPWGGGEMVVVSKILKRKPKRYHDFVFWAWLELFFTPNRYQF